MTAKQKVLDPAMRGAIERFFAEEIPFNRYLGLRLVSLERGVARVLLPFRPELVGDPMRPALHGGQLIPLAAPRLPAPVLPLENIFTLRHISCLLLIYNIII